ncbi:hypothetical protein D3C72_2322080 [compost metagenome]
MAKSTSSLAFLTVRPGLATTYMAVTPMLPTGVRSLAGWKLALKSDGLAVSTEVGATISV